MTMRLFTKTFIILMTVLLSALFAAPANAQTNCELAFEIQCQSKCRNATMTCVNNNALFCDANQQYRVCPFRRDLCEGTGLYCERWYCASQAKRVCAGDIPSPFPFNPDGSINQSTPVIQPIDDDRSPAEAPNPVVDTPAPNNPDTPAPNNPDTPAPNNPDTPAPNNPDTPAPNNPDAPIPNNPSTPVSNTPRRPSPVPNTQPFPEPTGTNNDQLEPFIPDPVKPVVDDAEDDTPWWWPFDEETIPYPFGPNWPFGPSGSDPNGDDSETAETWPWGPGTDWPFWPFPIPCEGGCISGDPHIRSMDGIGFGFQAVGEFTALKSDTSNMEIQVRLEPRNAKSRNNSVVTALAFKTGDIRVSLDVERGEEFVWINGEPVTMKFGPENSIIHKSGLFLTRPTKKSYGISTQDGMLIRARNLGTRMGISIIPPHKSEGSVRGLFGSPDGDIINEFTTRGGKTFITKGRPLSYDQLYKAFGNSWRITQKGSLFDYADGKSTDSYTDLTFPDRLLTVDNLDPAVRSRAERVCRKAKVLEINFNNCVYDVGFTGDESFANDHKRGEPVNPRLVFNDIDLTPPPPARVDLTGPKLSAPDRAEQTSVILVEWDEPAKDEDTIGVDFLGVAQTGNPASNSINLKKGDTSALLVIPAEKEDQVLLIHPHIKDFSKFEVSYSRRDHRNIWQVISVRPITIYKITRKLRAVDKAETGSKILVEWDKPSNGEDIYISEIGSDERLDSVTTAFSEEGDTSVLITMPPKAGKYEIRYKLNFYRRIVASKPITAVKVDRSLKAKKTARIDSRVLVEWENGANEWDFIQIAPKEEQDRKYRASTIEMLNPGQTSIRLDVPYRVGDYEIRYHIGGSEKVVARSALKVKK